MKKKSDKKLLLTFFVWAIIASPLTILFHECGHFIMAKLVGFEQAYISFAFTHFGLYSGTHYDLNFAIALVAGPLASLILTLLCAFLLKYSRHPVLYILGMFSMGRIARALVNIHPLDETKIARILDIPVLIPIMTSFGIFIFSILYFSSKLKREGKLYILYSIIVLGMVIGALIWFKFLGPILLPI